MTGVAHSKERKRKYRKHCAYRDYEPKLLTHYAEHSVGIAGKSALKPAVARSLTEQAAGCSGRESVSLLIASVPDILGIPDMSPGRKSACDMVFHF